MDKKEAGIRCSGCGKAYKVKVPVTDKPVSFKCKKCGKVLKIRVKAGPETPEPAAALTFDTAGDFADTGSDAGAPQFEPPPAPGGDLPQFDDSPSFDSGPEFEPPPAPDAPQFDGPPSFDDSQFEAPGGAGGAPAFEAPEFEAPPAFESDRFDASEGGGTPGSDAPPPEFETTQLPDQGAYQSTPGTGPIESPAGLEQYDFAAAPSGPEMTPATAEESAPAVEGDRRWVILEEDQVRGPFSENEIRTMIKEDEITAETSMRMGERPWIKAAEVVTFREMFTEAKRSRSSAVASIKLLDENVGVEEHTGPPFYSNFGAILPYPLGAGAWQPLAVFVGIAFALSTFLCLDFMLGLAVNIVGWIFLYGYLSSLMAESWRFPNSPPPEWRVDGRLAASGAKVFLVLFVLSLLPVTLCLLAMIYFFLHGMGMIGFVFTALTVVVFLGTMYVIPAALTTLTASDSVGAALNPGTFLKFVTQGGQSYRMAGAFSVGCGLVCMVIALLTSLLLVEIPMAGFVVGGLVMALVFSYAHFLWFRVVGLFARENKRLAGRILAAIPA